MKRESFKMPKYLVNTIKKMDAIPGYELFIAAANYSLEGIEPELTGASEIMWPIIVPELKKERANFLNGCKGGRPKLNK